MRKCLFVALALLALAGCAKSESTDRAPLTERERDSVLARQPIPGAAGVGEALEESDRAAADSKSMNALVDSLPR